MKVYLRTYGCRANQYDTEAVRAMLDASGVEVADDAADADFAVFNSCTVTAAAEADLRSDVRAASRTNPKLRAIVMGCAAGLPNRDEAVAPLATLPGVDAVIPGADLAGVSAALGIRQQPSAMAKVQTGARALLRIQDGCDEHCTFCATTIARGSNRSRPVAGIIREARALADAHPEIVITGIHIGTYGRDIGETLSSLMAMLVESVSDARFRLSSVEATEVDDKLAHLLVSNPLRLAPHLHAPLQSGSNQILKRMGRHWYTAESYEEAVRRLKMGNGAFALSADVITGFPGETEWDHEATLSMIERLPFTSLHVFPYSPRPGTAALRLGGPVSPETSRARARELRSLAERKAADYRASRIGTSCDVVVTGRGSGLTGDYLSVDVGEPMPRRTRFEGTLRDLNGRLTAFPTHTPG
jgi:threonylcarbamoyladenosine tRNA methylthiotransferase MtaB